MGKTEQTKLYIKKNPKTLIIFDKKIKYRKYLNIQTELNYIFGKILSDRIIGFRGFA